MRPESSALGAHVEGGESLLGVMLSSLRPSRLAGDACRQVLHSLVLKAQFLGGQAYPLMKFFA